LPHLEDFVNLQLCKNINLRERNPDAGVSRIFTKYDEENPDLSVEEVLAITASHFNTTPDTIIRKLWG
jgi:hypothetical protein